MRENKQSEVSSLGRIMGPSNTSRSRPWGRHETPNSVQLGEMAVGSVLLAISIMASVVTQAVTLPTTALAIEAGPLGGKSERTEGMPHLG